MPAGLTEEPDGFAAPLVAATDGEAAADPVLATELAGAAEELCAETAATERKARTMALLKSMVAG